MATDDPFYVGYHPTAPRPLGRAAGYRAAAFLVLGLGAAAVLGWHQLPAGPGVFEYGHERSLRGQLHEHPYPMLIVPASGDDQRQSTYTRYLLVGVGKHGAQAAAHDLDGQWVELRGTRIARPGREMLEVADGGITVTPPAPNVRLGIPMPPPVSLGTLTLTGEIVDSKCWLGVMHPATGTAHRGCATRCVSGGIPPLLMTTDSTGQVEHYLLTGANGEPAHTELKQYVGRRMTLTGEVVQEGDLLVLRVEKVVE